MRERPILFSAPMIRALLSSTKTQTRRIVKPGPAGIPDPISGYLFNGHALVREEGSTLSVYPIKCRYGTAGDRLWVREAFAVSESAPYADGKSDRLVVYRADQGRLSDGMWRATGGRWKPSIHMARDDSRITLEVTGVRVEPLQAISRGDAMNEGCPFANTAQGPDPRQWYAELWDSINGPGSWDANPWVWCIAFRRMAGETR